MNADAPRLRMIAGPNGSGKSTVKSVLRPELLGIYINPDEIEKEIRNQGFLSLDAFGVSFDAEELFAFFRESPLFKKNQRIGLIYSTIQGITKRAFWSPK